MKIVHNAVEYGMMAAMAEGLSVINSVSRSPIRGRQLHDGPVKLHRAPERQFLDEQLHSRGNRHRNQRSDNPQPRRAQKYGDDGDTRGYLHGPGR